MKTYSVVHTNSAGTGVAVAQIEARTETKAREMFRNHIGIPKGEDEQGNPLPSERVIQSVGVLGEEG